MARKKIDFIMQGPAGQENTAPCTLRITDSACVSNMKEVDAYNPEW